MNGIPIDYSQTETSDDPKWWTVDLQSKYSIGKIQLHAKEGDGKHNYYIVFSGKSCGY